MLLCKDCKHSSKRSVLSPRECKLIVDLIEGEPVACYKLRILEGKTPLSYDMVNVATGALQIACGRDGHWWEAKPEVAPND
jgi:hypothetical protein